MAKRQISSELTCPGCQSEFDPEIHAPFMGSCGHSLCVVCVNEKENELCPLCQANAEFPSNNSLASELLTALAETKCKRPKYVEEATFAPDEKVPVILDPKNRAFLPLVVNQLRPLDLIELASTCKSLHNFCLRSKEVKVDYELRWLCVIVKEDRLMFELAETNWEYERCAYGDFFLPLDYAGYRHKFLSSVVNRRKLKNYPSVFRLASLGIRGVVDARLLMLLRSFLAEFPIVSICEVDPQAVHDWSGFVQFLKDFKVRNVTIETLRRYYGQSLPITEEAMNYLLHELRTVSIDANISDELILNATVLNLNLPRASISKETFSKLLKRFANSNTSVYWKIGCQPFEFGHYNLFKVLPFDYNGALPEDRPIVFVKEEETKEFWILRNDGKILQCSQNDGIVRFSTDNYARIPCLKGPDDKSFGCFKFPF